ncbi:YcnI family copper-binding membrane protein [Kribbella sp. CA-294648]|uniref:YcnI family copper-binding membrane protein n=1 Tax=Kribbella sp. CA-294648 TaxID=3239948 RepID=UPI003D8B7FD5
MWRDDGDLNPADRPARRQARTWLGRVVPVGALALAGLAGAALPASAHVIVTPSTTVAGAHALLEFSVGHGCKDSPTSKITIQIPVGINSVTPTRTALWTVEKKLEKLDPAVVDAHGNKIVERVASVTFSTDTPLPDGQRDVFELAVQLPDAEGTNLVFPTIQTCQVGESAWIEVPQNGQTIKDLALPAPALVISKAADDGHHAGTSSAETAAPTPSSNDDGLLTYAALAAALLATALATTALLRQRRPT